MTRDRANKRQVRARMRATGERYTQAHSALFGSSIGTPPRSGPNALGGTMVREQLLEALERDGYAVVRNLVPKETINELARWVDALVDEDLDWRMQEVRRRREAGEADARAFPRGSEGKLHLDIDDARLAPLSAGAADLVQAIGTPVREGAGIAVCLPGWGGQSGLHQDLPGPAPDVAQWDGAILTWPLSPWEGMRLVPGSHRRDPVFREAYAGAVAPHPDEVYVDAGPGDVVINSIHIWKSGTLNRSTERRSELWVAYSDGEATAGKVADHWAQAEILHGGAPLDPGNYVERPT